MAQLRNDANSRRAITFPYVSPNITSLSLKKSSATDVNLVYIVILIRGTTSLQSHPSFADQAARVYSASLKREGLAWSLPSPTQGTIRARQRSS